MKRNLARRRMVYHSSSYDKNLCGHLVTSGNPKDRWSKRNYDLITQYEDSTEDIWNIVDEQNTTYWCSPHKHTYFDIIFKEPVRAKGYRVFSNQFDTNMNPTEWKLMGSLDGKDFVELDYQKCEDMTIFLYTYLTKEPILAINSDEAYRIFRFEIFDNFGEESKVALGEIDLISVDNKSLLKKFDGHFEQCWKSKGNSEEYLLLDLGAISDIREIVLEWGEEFAIEYEILASIDNQEWQSYYATSNGKGHTERFDLEVQAQYLKLLLHRSSGAHYVMHEWQVLGENALHTVSSDFCLSERDGKLYLGDGKWKIERASEVHENGTELSTADFSDLEWFPAVVPGTVLTSYMEAGAVCDYNDDENYMQHSDAFFTTNWWYRTAFKVDADKKGKRIWLNFDAINWKADIYLNGEQIGNIEGAFLRKKIDITSLVKYNEDNYLAVLIYCNDFPGPQKVMAKEFPHFINGGVTGLDEPCLAAGIGWDWITTVSGRNIGIYKDVYLSYTEEAQLIDPWFETCKIDYVNSNARVAFRSELSNTSSKLLKATIQCVIEDGLHTFSKEVILPANDKIEFEVDDIIIREAKLWYPVGYGKPELYNAEITILVNDRISDRKQIHFGIREFKYTVEDDVLSISCNGKKLCCVGGNWGMDDATMRNNERDYDIKVRLHADMNFNIIRNWVGQTNDEAFYSACDRHGVMVWDDFWLANPGDGPEPLNTDMFMINAEDKVRKVRNHPSIVLYCGRNEGNPTEPLASELPKLIKKLDPNRCYIPHSAEGVVSGYGPYHIKEKEFYFANTRNTIHSERGISNIPVLESVQKFLNSDNQWPISDAWVAHGFIIHGSQFCDLHCERLQKLYGKTDCLEEFVRKSQLLCYETYKAIFEAERAAQGGGMILWMSSSVMPNFAFQTYDYYYAINGGYIGAKLANQPVHAYHNPLSKQIVLDNRSGNTYKDVAIQCQLFDLKGNALWEERFIVQDCYIGQHVITTLDEYKETVFLKILVQVDSDHVYKNFEWIYMDDNQTTGLETLEEAKLSVLVNGENKTILVKNQGTVPALQINLSIKKLQSGERVLPVFWSDNFFSLMPGEEQEIIFTFYDELENDNLGYCVEGFNVDQFLVEV